MAGRDLLFGMWMGGVSAGSFGFSLFAWYYLGSTGNHSQWFVTILGLLMGFAALPLALQSLWLKTFEVDDSGVRMRYGVFSGWGLPWNEIEKINAPSFSSLDPHVSRVWIQFVSKGKRRLISALFMFGQNDDFREAVTLAVEEGRKHGIPIEPFPQRR
jgi:hypothetical protein